MRKGIEIEVVAADCARPDAIVADRNRRQKDAERARIILLSADGVGTLAIMRQLGCAKATVWRWQEPHDPRQLRQPQAPKVLSWLRRHPRLVFHFTPTHVLSRLTRRRLKRSVFARSLTFRPRLTAR